MKGVRLMIKTEIKELNTKINIPLFLTKLGADPRSIKKLRGNDYRCPCFWRGGDNPHGCGITFHTKKEKWLLTDFLHNTFGNVDLIDFAMKVSHCSFGKAIELLKECANGELDGCNGYSKEYEYKEKVIHPNVLELFDYGLHPYLHQRGYTPEVAHHFGLGYSAIGELIDRIVIPIVDEKGKLVAIQGRTFVNEEPKYLYLDGSGTQAKETLYNLYVAKKHILQKGYVILVEGAPSVWRAYQYGIKNVVATLSTSVTERQLSLLKALNVKIIIAFDFDIETQAGQYATLKLAKRLKESNFQNGVYTFNLGLLGLSGAIDDLSIEDTAKALKSIKKLF